MAEPKKLDAPAEAAPASAPAPGDYQLKGMKQKEFYVPLTGRTYKLDDVTQDQLKQLHELGWPHVEQIP